MKQQNLINTPYKSQPQAAFKKRPLRILFAGDSSSGKTTLISVLRTGIFDNSFGSARKKLLKHLHEKEFGHTAEINSYILNYDKNAVPIYGDIQNTSEISEKCIHVFDGCGLKGYLKTMVHGFTSTVPDCVFLLVNAEKGVSSVTKDHMGIALTLHIPIVIVVTKTDLCSSETLSQTLESIKDLILKGTNKEYVPLYYSFVLAAKFQKIAESTMKSQCIPVLTASAVSGDGISNIHKLLFTMNPIKPMETCKLNENPDVNKNEVWIRKSYDVPSIGIVLEGLIKLGKLRTKQYMKLGPFNGTFKLVVITSIVTCKGKVPFAENGEDVALQIQPAQKGTALNIEELKKTKGLVLVDPKIDSKRLAKMFDAEIVVVKKSFMRKGRVINVHTGNVLQAAMIDDLAGSEHLKKGEKGLIRCRFSGEESQYMKEGEKVIFRSGLTVAVGVISKLYI